MMLALALALGVGQQIGSSAVVTGPDAFLVDDLGAFLVTELGERLVFDGGGADAGNLEYVFDPLAADFDFHTFTRASLGLLDPAYDMAYQEYAIDARRLGDGGYVWMEGQRQNIVPNPFAQQAGTGFTKVNVSAVDIAGLVSGANAAAYPAATLTKTTATAGAAQYRRSTSVAATRYTFSAHLKGSASSLVASFGISDDAVSYQASDHVVLRGQPLTITGAPGRRNFVDLSSSVYSWLALTLQGNAPSIMRSYLFPTGSGNTTFPQDTICWCMQTEVGEFASTPIPGSGSPTRAADSDIRLHSIPFRSAGFKVKLGPKGGSLPRTIWSYHSADGNEAIRLQLSGDYTSVSLIARTGGVDQTAATISGLTWAMDELHRISASYAADGTLRLSLDGGAITTATAAAMPASGNLVQESRGAFNGTNHFFGGIGKGSRSMAVLTGATLQAYGA